ncbi:hypothetical protein PPROV_000444600 [Pycnococcus provasolii]|uniref:RWP-RK domain-containing protein n=1 Tax=Pycnococcus provasolii TaxID=41880 RepID=A0A830HE73_9CHLO|nr:hypothetical protein PPROV_000444600 [Pycnococcus provasolii]
MDNNDAYVDFHKFDALLLPDDAAADADAAAGVPPSSAAALPDSDGHLGAYQAAAQPRQVTYAPKAEYLQASTHAAAAAAAQMQQQLYQQQPEQYRAAAAAVAAAGGGGQQPPPPPPPPPHPSTSQDMNGMVYGHHHHQHQQPTNTLQGFNFAAHTLGLCVDSQAAAAHQHHQQHQLQLQLHQQQQQLAAANVQHQVNLEGSAHGAYQYVTAALQNSRQVHGVPSMEGTVHGGGGLSAHHQQGVVKFAAGDSTRGGSHFTNGTITSNRSGETLTTRGGDSEMSPDATEMARVPVDKEERAKQLQALQSLFAYRLKEAAARLGVGTTSLKRMCRAHGIKRWPHRKVFSVARCVEQLRNATGCTTGENAAALTMAAVSRGASASALMDSSLVRQASSKGDPNVVGMSMRGENHFQALVSEAHAAADGPANSDLPRASSKVHAKVNMNNRDDDKSPTENGIMSSARRPGTDSPQAVTRLNTPSSDSADDTTRVMDGNGNKTTKEEFANPIFDSRGAIRNGKAVMVAAAGVHDDKISMVKVEYGDDVVKLRMQQDDALSYRALLASAKQRFRMSYDCRMRLKYQDADGEWVLLSDDTDLIEAWAGRDKGIRSGHLRLRMSQQVRIGD